MIMTTLPEKLSVTCRPATTADEAAMLEITRTIWDGEDYFPYIWHEWLAEREGVLAAAEWNGRVIGLGKLSRQSDVDWWLAGLRTHPEFEGHGVGKQMFAYLYQEWLRQGRGTVRLSTRNDNFAVHRLCQAFGFTKVAEFAPFHATVIAAEAGAFEAVRVDEIERILHLLESSPWLARFHGLLDLGWKWTALTPEMVAQKVLAGMAFWWRKGMGATEGESLLLLSKDEEIPGAPVDGLVMGLHCPEEQLGDFLLDYRRLASALGLKRACWNVIVDEVVMKQVVAGGMQRSWDGSMFVYEKVYAGAEM